jgi:hypothetical protein
MAIRDNLTEHDIWEILIQYLSEFHDADVNSIAKFVYADTLHEGTSFYVIDSYDNTQRNKSTLKCYKNNLNIHGEIIHFFELDKSEKFTLNQMIEKLELNLNPNVLKLTEMEELYSLSEDHPLRVLSHAYMLYEYDRSKDLYKLRLNEIDIPNSVHDKFHYDQRHLVDYSNVHHLHPESTVLTEFFEWLPHASFNHDEILTFKNLVDEGQFNPNALIPKSVRNKGGLLKPLVDEHGNICSAALFSNQRALSHSLLNGAILQSSKLSSEGDAKNLVTFDLESAALLNSAIPLLKTNIYAGLSLENTLNFAAKLISEKKEVALIIPDIYSRPDVRIINMLFDFLYTYHSESFSIILLGHKSPHKFAIKPENFAFTLYDAYVNYGIDYSLDMFYSAIDLSLENKEHHLDNLSSFSKHHLHVKKAFNLLFPNSKIEQSLSYSKQSQISEAIEHQTISVLNNDALDKSTINWLSDYEHSEEIQRFNKINSSHMELLAKDQK